MGRTEESAHVCQGRWAGRRPLLRARQRELTVTRQYFRPIFSALMPRRNFFGRGPPEYSESTGHPNGGASSPQPHVGMEYPAAAVAPGISENGAGQPRVPSTTRMALRAVRCAVAYVAYAPAMRNLRRPGRPEAGKAGADAPSRSVAVQLYEASPLPSHRSRQFFASETTRLP